MRLYPRKEIDPEHCHQIRQAMLLGAKFPPLVICRKSLRIADGFHRATVLKERGEGFEVECVEKDYATERELFLDAVRMNAGHGKPLNAEDKGYCAMRAKKLGFDESFVARELFVEVGFLKPLLAAAVVASKLDAATGEERKPHQNYRNHRNQSRSATNHSTICKDISKENPTSYVSNEPGDAGDPVDKLPSFTGGDKQSLARKCAKTLVDLLEGGDTIDLTDESLRELLEMLNWQIEEQCGFSAK